MTVLLVGWQEEKEGSIGLQTGVECVNVADSGSDGRLQSSIVNTRILHSVTLNQ